MKTSFEHGKASKRKCCVHLNKICRLIGLLSRRDKNKTVVKVFYYALVKRGTFFGCSELSRISRINRLTCLHHLKRMKQVGIIESRRGEYRLVYSSLQEIVNDFREQSNTLFDEVAKSAKNLDEELGIT